MITGLQNMPYEHKLVALVLTTFETRMLRADLIQVFKIAIYNLDSVNKDIIFLLLPQVIGGAIH